MAILNSGPSIISKIHIQIKLLYSHFAQIVCSW